jgi:hypothetical protein
VHRIGWKNTLAFSGYTDTFKIHRKNIAKVAGSTVSLSVFDRVQEEESVHFLLNLLDSPERLFDHIKKGNDYLVDLVGKTMAEFAESTVPGRWAVDIMPFCESIHVQVVSTWRSNSYSEIRPRLAPWNRIQEDSAADGCPSEPDHRTALPIRQAADA